MTRVALLFALVSASTAFAGPPPRAELVTKYGRLPIFPRDNPWNTPITRAKLHPLSDQYIRSIGAEKTLHPDFGTTWRGVPNGIPYVVVGPKQKKVEVQFEYRDESDKGPYPIPDDVPIEGGPESNGDRHILIVSPRERRIYELFHARKTDAGWTAGSGAIWDLRTNKLRPWGWTSADAAGLPIFPGLVRYDEAVERGVIPHAIRFTVARSQKAYIPPATHQAGRSDDVNLPPMGLRLRLKPHIEAKRFPKQARPIIVAMQRYGLIVADNGSDWYLSGAPHPKWSDDQLRSLRKIKGSDFEAVVTSKLRR